MKSLRQRIIEIIGFMMRPEVAELKADEVLREVQESTEFMRKPTVVVANYNGFTLMQDKWISGGEVLDDGFGNLFFASIPIEEDRYKPYSLLMIYPEPKIGTKLYINYDYLPYIDYHNEPIPFPF